MTKNFEFLKNITNADYVTVCNDSKTGNLYQLFTNIETRISGGTIEDCIDALKDERSAGEKIAKLIEYNLIKEQERTYKDIIKRMTKPYDRLNDEMYQKLGKENRDKIASYLDLVREEGNLAVHASDVKEASATAITMMRYLHWVLKIYCVKMKFVKKVPDYITVGGEKKPMKGSIEITRTASAKEGKPWRLYANISIPNREGYPVTYTWIRDDGSVTITKGSYYEFDDMDQVDSQIRCKISCQELGGPIYSDPYLIKKEDIEFLPPLKVKMEIKKSTLQEDGGFDLEAVIDNEGQDIDLSAFSYQWGFINKKNKDQLLEAYKEKTFPCTPNISIDKTYFCEIHCEGYEGTVREYFRPITEEDFIAPPESEETVYPNVISEIQDVPTLQEEPIVETENNVVPEPTIEVEKEPVEVETLMSEQTHTEQADEELLLGNSIVLEETAKEIIAPQFRCFDSNAGRLHYFVAPREDCYATHALDVSGYNHYLYTLIKDQGFDRAIIVGNFSEDGGDNYPVLTYDAFSEHSFLHSKEFESFLSGTKSWDESDKERFLKQYEKKDAAPLNDIRAAMNGHRSGKRTGLGSDTAAPALSKFGKRTVRTLVRPSSVANSDGSKETLANFITNEAKEAMESSQVKTAIAIPLEFLIDLLSNVDNAINLITSIMRRMIDRAGANVLIVTVNQEEDLYRLFEQPVMREFEKVDAAANRAVNRLQGEQRASAYSDVFAEELEKQGRILIAAHHPGKDEVANFLLRMKFDSPERFEKLKVSHVYALADFILSNCQTSERTQKTFPDLRNNTWYVGHLRNLEVALRDPEVVDALIEKAQKLWPRLVNPVKNQKSSTVERVYAGVKHIQETPRIAPINIDRMSPAEKESEYIAATAELNQMVGLETVKKKLENLFLVSAAGSETAPGSYVFAGNPGTGKTVVARLVGQIMHAQGILRKGHVIEVTKADLVSEHVGGSGPKTRQKCEEALDGVLFIDEAYQLVNTEDNTSQKFSNAFDEEAYTTLLAFMENNRDRLCVIAAGYPSEMERFREANPGMKRRIPDSHVIEFPDYTADELHEIMLVMADKKPYPMTAEFDHEAQKAIKTLWGNRDSQFGNAGDVRTFLEECWEEAIRRVHEQKLNQLELRSGDIPMRYKAEELTSEERKQLRENAKHQLDNMIGLEGVKKELRKLINRKTKLKGAKKEPGHYVFAGNPGTGKTVVARQIGTILKANGILKKGHTVEVSKADLVAEYLGQSAIKTREQCKKALDGVLFVDEAYELVNTTNPMSGPFSSSYDEEAYTTILKFMEDNSSRICVIFAGYEDKMRMFLEANSGMEQRVKSVIHFPDYADDELIDILKLQASQYAETDIKLSDSFLNKTKEILPVLRQIQGKAFANGRSMRRYLENCVDNALIRLDEDNGEEVVDSLMLLDLDIPSIYKDPNSEGSSDKSTDSEKRQDLHFEKIPRSIFDTLPAPYTAKEIDSSDFPSICRRAVARIETEYSTATAFLISPDGYAITCAHAIAKKEDFTKIATKKLEAELEHDQGGKKKFAFRIVNMRPDIDMALIKLDIDQWLPYLKLAEDRPVEREIKFGEDCFLLGFPEGRKGIMLDSGNISTEAESGAIGEQGEIYHFNGNAFPGDSGGPLVAKKDGCVIGILRGAHGKKEGAKFNFIKPIHYFWKEFVK